jgi:penicillin-binding protein 1A
VDQRVNMEYSLTFSKNVPSVNVFKMVGTKRYEEWVDKLGFRTPLVPEACRSKTCTALALGAVSVYLDDLTRAFAIFARNGRFIDFIRAKRIFDRDGNLIEDNSVYYDPMLSGADRLNRLAHTAGNRPKQAIPARAAFLTTKLLRKVITHGFSSIVRNTGVNAAGKTGTSSATMDTSFVGFTSRWITSVWLGDEDRQRPLGLKDAAYMTAVPMWSRYMRKATQGHENLDIPWEVPEGVSPRDRGDHKLGERLEMPLIYRKKPKAEDFEAAGLPVPLEPS